MNKEEALRIIEIDMEIATRMAIKKEELIIGGNEKLQNEIDLLKLEKLSLYEDSKPTPEPVKFKLRPDQGKKSYIRKIARLNRAICDRSGSCQ